MSWLDAAFDQALSRLNWTSSPSPANPNELVVGDYARGFLVLKMDGIFQVARRSVRGEPSLKMWSSSFGAVQHYLAFWIVREIRFREGSADLTFSTDPGAVAEPFRLVSGHPLQSRIAWGEDEWAEFGAGSEFAAVQFAQYARGTVGDAISRYLA